MIDEFSNLISIAILFIKLYNYLISSNISNVEQ